MVSGGVSYSGIKNYSSQLCQTFWTSSSSSMASMSFCIRNLRFRGRNGKKSKKMEMKLFAKSNYMSTNSVIQSQHLS